MFTDLLISANFFTLIEQKKRTTALANIKKGRIEIQPVLIQYPMKNHFEIRMNISLIL